MLVYHSNDTDTACGAGARVTLDPRQLAALRRPSGRTGRGSRGGDGGVSTRISAADGDDDESDESDRGMMVALFQIDNTFGNPHGAWEAMGGPTYPTPDEFARLRAEVRSRRDARRVRTSLVASPLACVTAGSAPRLAVSSCRPTRGRCGCPPPPPGRVALATPTPPPTTMPPTPHSTMR